MAAPKHNDENLSSDSKHSPRYVPRIPSSLQAVFIAANRGILVHIPPPERVASKLFHSRWMKWGRNSKKQKESAKCTANTTLDDTTRTLDEKLSDSIETPVAKIERPIALNKSPQEYLDATLSARGYSTTRYQTLQTGYYNKPSPLQLASHHVYLIQFLREGNTSAFADIFACGISPNPCNAYGESLMHQVCRRSDSKFLKIMLDNGAETQVADDRGRTPLHDACWTVTPCFDAVEMIIQRDIHLFYMGDVRGDLPLSYVRTENWPMWRLWLEAHLDTYWPVRDVAKLGPERPPCLCAYRPNGFPLVEPENALTVGLASLVVSGKMSLHMAKSLMMAEDRESDEDDSSNGDSDSHCNDSDSDSESYYSDSDDDYDSEREDDDVASELENCYHVLLEI